MTDAPSVGDVAAEPWQVQGELSDVSGLVRGEQALLVITLARWAVAEQAPHDSELHVYTECASAAALSERMQTLPDLGAMLRMTVRRDATRDVLGRSPTASEVWLCGDVAEVS